MKWIIGSLGVLLVAVMIACAFFGLRWVMVDEHPLDYSELPPVVGISDPEVNGFTYISEYLRENEVVGLDDFDSRYTWDAASADLSELEETVLEYEELCAAFKESINREEMVIDVPATPDASIPSASALSTYIQVMVLKARLHEVRGDYDRALSTLIDGQIVLQEHTRCRGCSLIQVIISVSGTRLIAEEIEGLLAEYSFSDEALASALEHYQIFQLFSPAMSSAFQQEFNFSKYCIETVCDDPQRFSDLDEDESILGDLGSSSNIPFLLHKNRTINRFYRVNVELSREVSKPVCKRSFPLAEAMESYVQDRPKFWLIRDRNPVGKVLGAILFPTSEKVLEVVALADFQARSTYVSFALKRYHQRHGQLPESIDELVPDYAKEIPEDPYSGKRLVYSKEEAILYSVGADCTDSGGSDYPFLYNLSEDEDKYSAERDALEPTYLFRYALFN